MMEKIFEAIDFSQNAHKGQYRKKSKTPYIVHPINVMQILIENGDSEEVAIAGVLHDVVEDTPYKLDDIRELFGDRVAELVNAASEPKRDASWTTRKTHTVEFLKTVKDKDILHLICADKLHNVITMKEAYKEEGDDLWNRFNESKVKQEWYFTSLSKIFLNNYTDKKDDIFKRFSEEVKLLFEKQFSFS